MIRASLALPAALIALFAAAGSLAASFGAPDDRTGALSNQVAAAQSEATRAKERAALLRRQASEAADRSAKAALSAASLAADVQRAEAGVRVQALLANAASQHRQAIERDVAMRQAPVGALLAGLVQITRKPPVLALMQPGSSEDLVHLQAVLSDVKPILDDRTADLRAGLSAARKAEADQRAALARLNVASQELLERRRALLAAAAAGRSQAGAGREQAAREDERALALAEKSRDLGNLAARLTAQDRADAALAGLQGPAIRPGMRPTPSVMRRQSQSPAYQLPLEGPIIAGFGEAPAGITIRAGRYALAVAPQAGRVLFAGPFRRYGTVVIIRHDDGAVSLVTGLAGAQVETGQDVVGGAPIGFAPPAGGAVGLELRVAGRSVDPLPRAAGN